jgi:murein DD-endopeptidase MepM/ murein hydrolase activator NlpD
MGLKTICLPLGRNNVRNLLLCCATLFLALEAPAHADGLLVPPAAKKLEGLPKQILLGPIYKERHFCSEHTATSWDLGDSLATDCIVVSDFGHGYPKLYRTDGKTNEDWYGWHADVLVPIDGKVVGTIVNNVENTPGTFGKGQASAIQIVTDQNQLVILVHVTDLRVTTGQLVKKGQLIARVGNSGIADAPHTHVGAYDLRTALPLQIRWDLAAQAKLSGDH